MAEILKRNGKKVPYDGEKIIVAIEKAMCEVGARQKDIAQKIEKEIYELLSKDSQPWTVERISDQVEIALMENKLFAVAKAYILYREIRSKERDIDIPGGKANMVSYHYSELGTFRKESSIIDLIDSDASFDLIKTLSEVGERHITDFTIELAVNYDEHLESWIASVMRMFRLSPQDILLVQPGF